MRIIPMRDLKDTVKIEKLCAEEREPIFVTKNGYGRLVVMDIEYFEQVFGKFYEAHLINKGLKEAEEGKGRDGFEVLKEIKEKYGF